MKTMERTSTKTREAVVCAARAVIDHWNDEQFRIVRGEPRSLHEMDALIEDLMVLIRPEEVTYGH
jgi:hypothetical protein